MQYITKFQTRVSWCQTGFCHLCLSFRFIKSLLCTLPINQPIKTKQKLFNKRNVGNILKTAIEQRLTDLDLTALQQK